MSKKSNDPFNNLSKIVILGFFTIFVGIVWFLFKWQVVQTNEFQTFAEERFKESNLSSTRGAILSKDGETLAYSEPRWDVFVYVPDLENAEAQTETRAPIQTRREFVQKVSTIIGVSGESIERKLDSNSLWIKIAEKVDYDTKLQLENIPTDRFGEDFKITGINFEFTSQRLYPEGDLAAHVIGFIGKDLSSNDIGRGGIEAKFNGTLEYQEGFVAQETDKFGNTIAFSDSTFIRAKRGSDVVLTLDNQAQKIIQRKICEGVERFDAKSGSAVLMDPKSGEIIAMANCPTFNPNTYFEVTDPAAFSNSAVVVPYEVGSIAKVFTMAAAVDQLEIKPNDIIINGHNGCEMIQASNFDEQDVRRICTADRKSQGPLSASDALIKSDNLAFVNLGHRLGAETFYHYLDGFGVGKPSNIDLSGESIGYLPSINDPLAWHPVDVAVFSFGHSYQLNLVQATKGIGAIANRGWVMRPYIVKSINHADGTNKTFEPVVEEKVIEDASAKTVEKMMNDVFKEHASHGFDYLSNYPVGTKSGTALIPFKDKVGYSSDVNVTYVGFDASNDRHFVLAMKLEAPQAVKKLSFFSVRPLWFETYSELKDHYNIEPVSEM